VALPLMPMLGLAVFVGLFRLLSPDDSRRMAMPKIPGGIRWDL
jgi:hypothetical protein